MKSIFTLLIIAVVLVPGNGRSQVLLNELYTDPGSGKHEFFELYNGSSGNSSTSMNNYTLVTFFEISGQKGFYVMDLPNLSVASKGYFVGSSALPYNYQGVTNSTASDFNWNSIAFTSNQGALKKWIQGGTNLLDGNIFYDQASLPANFNDFFYRRTGNGASYTIFLYKDGQLVNSFVGGTGGQATIINDIVNMPSLYVDMTGASPDFTITFTGYASIPVENTGQDAGSDNGFIREMDGGCYSWDKSSSQKQHTPKATNGIVTGTSGTISVSSAIARGTPATGSVVNYDVVGASSSVFPVTMEVYLDNGTVSTKLDAGDTYVTSNTETVISQGPFYTTFFPYNADILIVVKSNAGCIDKVQYIPNWIHLGINQTSFTGRQVNNRVELNWTVQVNEAVHHFEVERITDGQRFINIGSVNVTGDEGQENYSFIDPTLSNRSIYRLKIIEKSNEINFSENLVIENRKENASFFIFNNPVKDVLGLSYNSPAAEKLTINIYDMSGKKRMNSIVNGNRGLNTINVSLAQLNRGIYLVEIVAGSQNQALKFVKE